MSRERGLARFCYECAHVVEDALFGLGQGQSGIQQAEQTGGFVHAAYEVAHLLQRPTARLDHQVDSVTEHIEISVGDQCGHLDEFVVDQVESSHFAVDPDQQVVRGHL
jgi:hypothetical protein